jgi:hypothetical protein
LLVPENSLQNCKTVLAGKYEPTHAELDTLVATPLEEVPTLASELYENSRTLNVNEAFDARSEAMYLLELRIYVLEERAIDFNIVKKDRKSDKLICDEDFRPAERRFRDIDRVIEGMSDSLRSKLREKGVLKEEQGKDTVASECAEHDLKDWLALNLRGVGR